MNPHQTIHSITQEVERRLEGEGTGHDWWHILRVRNTATIIGTEEGADLIVVELGALLHDIADWKFHDGDDTVGPREARKILETHDVQPDTIDHVCDIVATISYKGAGVATPMQTIEGKCVQDADRLDALGAIGIARAFAYGGSKHRPLYDPSIQPVLHQTAEAYKANQGTTINHFHEKLLLLRDRMNTETGRRLAETRHRYMEEYLEQFHAEWNGKR